MVFTTAMVVDQTKKNYETVLLEFTIAIFNAKEVEEKSPNYPNNWHICCVILTTKIMVSSLKEYSFAHLERRSLVRSRDGKEEFWYQCATRVLSIL